MDNDRRIWIGITLRRWAALFLVAAFLLTGTGFTLTGDILQDLLVAAVVTGTTSLIWNWVI